MLIIRKKLMSQRQHRNCWAEGAGLWLGLAGLQQGQRQAGAGDHRQPGPVVHQGARSGRSQMYAKLYRKRTVLKALVSKPFWQGHMPSLYDRVESCLAPTLHMQPCAKSSQHDSVTGPGAAAGGGRVGACLLSAGARCYV